MVRGKLRGTRNEHSRLLKGNHYLSARYVMHLHTMRALFASRDAFFVLLLSCIQPQLQRTVVQPGILYEFFVSVSSTCQKNNPYLIGALRLLMLI
jgi:hypothetical protein